MRRTFPGILLAACLLASACADDDSSPTRGATPVARGDRLLGIDVNEADDGDFERAFDAARGAGMDVVSLSLAWDDIEPTPGAFDSPYPAIANLFYGAADVAVALTLAPLDTNNDRRPADLAGLAFDDPEVIARFNALLTWVLQQMPDVRLAVLSIGNEIDGSLAGAGQWASYRRFFEAAASQARDLRPGLRVGAKAMFSGLTGPQRSELTELNTLSDVVLATYYPLGDDFSPRDPVVVGDDLDRLVALYPDRPLMLMETGYPSGELCGGSPARQAQFVREIFGWWDRHAGQVELVTFTWLTDIPEAAVEHYVAYYGVGSPCFAEYLRSLGLRTSSGSDKAGFRELRAQAGARGWSTSD